MSGYKHLGAQAVVLVSGGLLLTHLDQSKDLVASFYRYFVAYFDWPDLGAKQILYLLASFLGALLPDMDSEHSLLGRHFYIPLEHRTWLHSIWPCFILGVAGYRYPIFLWVLLGYVFHLFFDAFSYMGVCWFYPISQYKRLGTKAKVKKCHPFKFYRTKDVTEGLFFALILVIPLIFIGAYHFMGARFLILV